MNTLIVILVSDGKLIIFSQSHLVAEMMLTTFDPCSGKIMSPKVMIIQII